MIHHGRAKRPVMQGTYGIVTDGLRWIFLHVNKEGEVCLLIVLRAMKS
jgi:hypothetical protein